MNLKIFTLIIGLLVSPVISMAQSCSPSPTPTPNIATISMNVFVWPLTASGGAKNRALTQAIEHSDGSHLINYSGFTTNYSIGVNGEIDFMVTQDVKREGTANPVTARLRSLKSNLIVAKGECIAYTAKPMWSCHSFPVLLASTTVGASVLPAGNYDLEIVYSNGVVKTHRILM